jgi:hypothetical protein
MFLTIRPTQAKQALTNHMEGNCVLMDTSNFYFYFDKKGHAKD